MRSKKDIENKLTEVYDKRLKNRYRKYLKRNHLNCKYNKRVIFDKYNKVAICINRELSSEKEINICDSEQNACNCPLYECKYTRESVEDKMREEIKDPKVCGQKEPKIAVLIWMLHGEKFPEEIKQEKLNLWARIQNAVRGIMKKIGIIGFA